MWEAESCQLQNAGGHIDKKQVLRFTGFEENFPLLLTASAQQADVPGELAASPSDASKVLDSFYTWL